MKKILKLKLIWVIMQQRYQKDIKNMKNITQVDTSSFALKTNLSSLKTEVDKLDIDKLVPVPTDLSKLSNVVKNDVVKRALYNKLAAKVDNIDTSDFVLKTDKAE